MHMLFIEKSLDVLEKRISSIIVELDQRKTSERFRTCARPDSLDYITTNASETNWLEYPSKDVDH
jgi:hypothetical protein